MGKIRSALYKFMYGRYGVDKLGNCLLITYVIFIFLQTILNLFIHSWIFDIVCSLISLGLVALILFRMLSRNLQKRRRENEVFCGFIKLQKNKYRDRKTHVYRKCPGCSATLRLPKAKGKHSVVCPRCKNRFSVRG